MKSKKKAKVERLELEWLLDLAIDPELVSAFFLFKEKVNEIIEVINNEA